jgi:hypothetical protein
MVTYAFDLGIWTLLFFLLGMYKPEWPLFFLKKPDRFLILIITTIFVMITFTLYGEGTRREKLALEEAKTLTPEGADSALPSVPTTVPVPTPAPAPAPAPSSDKAKTGK